MKRFLKNVAVFSLITIALLAIGEIVARSLPSSYSYKRNWIINNGNNITTLVLGTSHTYYGIRPDMLGEGSFNLANVSQTPEYDLSLLKTYLPYMPCLKRIIIPISYFTYRDPALEKGEEWTLAVRYKTQMRLPMHSDYSIYNLEITDFKAYTGKLKNIVAKNPSNLCDSLGFGLGFDIAHRDPSWQKKGRERAAKHTLSTPGRMKEVLKIQKQTIAFAEENGIEPIFLTTPVCETYTAAMEPEQFSEMKKCINELEKEYGIKYFDFMNDARFADTDFYDPDHLSDTGASRLSRILADTLKSACNR